MWVWSELITTLSTLYLPRPRVTTIVEMENGLEIPEAASTVDSIVLRIHECQGVRFGNFTLKSGISSPIYIDVRETLGFPDLMVHQ